MFFLTKLHNTNGKYKTKIVRNDYLCPKFIRAIHLLQQYRAGSKGILFTSLVVMLLLALPLLLVLFSLLNSGNADTDYAWLLGKDAIVNSILLCVFVGLFSILIGVSTAWLVSRYDFPLSKFFSRALLLPLTIPVYIMAYSYSGIFNYAGPLQSFLRQNFSEETASTFYFDFLQLPFLIACLVLALFPYVFISARISFSLSNSHYIEAAKSLGSSSKKVFFKIALPLARPAIATGLFLVLMELLNDYGAANYFGIKTFTTVIFQAWGLDLQSALFLAAIVLIFIFLLMSLEQLSRGKAKFSNSKQTQAIAKEKLKGRRAFLAFVCCALPFLFGFLIPVIYLFSSALKTYSSVITTHFLNMTWNSLVLAGIAALVVVICGILVAYNKQIHSSKLSQTIARFSTIGYAIPGAVIAVAVLVPSGIIDNWLVRGNETKTLFLTGSIALMIYAYTIRFLAVAYHPLEISLQKNARSLRESSRSLGKNSLLTLLKVELPVIHPAIWAAGILVFVDVLKELPLTLILRPFNFDTLSTETYRYAKVMESVPESANAAIIIIFIGALPILFLHRLIAKNA